MFLFQIHRIPIYYSQFPSRKKNSISPLSKTKTKKGTQPNVENVAEFQETSNISLQVGNKDLYDPKL
jgi:hypothetical protein